MRNFLEKYWILLAFCYLIYVTDSFQSIVSVALTIAGTLYFISRRNNTAIFILFWFTLIMSDNYFIGFGRTTKPILILLFSGYYFLHNSTTKGNRLLLYFLPFLGIAALALLMSPDIGSAVQKYLSYGLLVFSIPIVALQMGKSEDQIDFRSLFYFSLIIVLVCLFQYWFGDSSISHGGRLRGLFGNPNGLGMFCLFSILLLETIRYFKPDSVEGYEYYVSLLIIFLVIFLTGSRASLISVVIFYMFKRLTRISPFIGLTSVILLLLTYDIIVQSGIDILINIGLQQRFRITGEQTTLASGRLIAWKFAWDEIQKSFFLGRGWNYDEIWIYGPISKLLSSLNHQGGVHNSFLIFWLNNGLLGLTAFVGGMVALVVEVAKKNLLIFPIIYACLFQAYFEPWMAGSLNPYTLIFLLILTMTLNTDLFLKK